MLENPALRSLGSAGLQSQGFSTIPGREWEPSAQLCCYYFLFPCKEGSYRLATALLSLAILKKWKPLSAYTRATSGMEWVRMCVCLWRDASTAMHAKLQGQWKEPSCKATRWGTSGPSLFRHPRYTLVIIDQFTRWVCPWPRAWDDSKETCVQLYCLIWTPSWVARQPVSSESSLLQSVCKVLQITKTIPLTILLLTNRWSSSTEPYSRWSAMWTRTKRTETSICLYSSQVKTSSHGVHT